MSALLERRALRPALSMLRPALHSIAPRVRVRSPQHVVVVGNGMVSHRFCKAMQQRATQGRYRLTVLGEEALPAYDRIRLSESLASDPQALLLDPPAWYEQAGIHLRLGTRVQALRPASRCIVLADAEQLPYDLLVLSTGAAPRVPELPGMDCDRVFVYRTVSDVARIRAACRGGGRAAVIGGGLLGIEAARVLRDAQATVLLIEQGLCLMPRQLDDESGRWLSERVRERGVTPLLGEELTEVQAGGGGLRLRFASGRCESVDLLVVAAGIRPRDELARAAGLRTAVGGGIIVDDGLRTSERSIYAIGECAVHRGKHYGLVSPGYAMADALAARLRGRPRRFVGGDMSCHLKLLDVPVAAVGIYDQQARAVTFANGSGRRTLLLDGRRLIGATAVGDWPELPLVHDAALRSARISSRHLSRFRRTGSLWADRGTAVGCWPERAVVCTCTGVNRGQLGACVAQGLLSVEALTRKTGAGGVCGSCKPLLGQLLGTPVLPERAGAGVVRWASMAVLLVLALMIWAPLVPVAVSVDSPLYGATRWLRDGGYKQLTGYGLLGVGVLGASLSVRKRLPSKVRGTFGHYRAFHVLAGLFTLGLLVFHSGAQAGNGLNFTLFTCFLTLCGVGALCGWSTAAETFPGRAGGLARRLRPYLTTLHLALLWPLPVLIGLHIWVAYHF